MGHRNDYNLKLRTKLNLVGGIGLNGYCRIGIIFQLVDVK